MKLYNSIQNELEVNPNNNFVKRRNDVRKSIRIPCAVEDVVQDQTVHSKMDNIYILPRSQRLYAILWFHIRYEQLVGVVNDAHNL